MQVLSFQSSPHFMAGSAVEYGLLPDLIAAIEDKVPGIAVTHFPLFNIIPVQHDGCHRHQTLLQVQ